MIINVSEDAEIKEYVVNYFDSIKDGHTNIYTENQSDLCRIYYKTGFKKGNNPLTLQYKKFNLINNKHIPKEVYQSSLNYRMQVLAGIIDTDGFIKSKTNKSGASYEISMSRPELIADIGKLAASCGFKVSYSDRIRNENRIIIEANGNEQTLTGESHEYSVLIKGDIINIPVRVSRKKINSQRITDPYITKLDVTPNGIGNYVGITLKNYGLQTDNLFFLKDFTVVHNCGSNPTLLTS
jgi:replicative DNA helicase